MFGWFNQTESRASSASMLVICLSALKGGSSRLIATNFSNPPRDWARARKTSAMPPLPRGRSRV